MLTRNYEAGRTSGYESLKLDALRVTSLQYRILASFLLTSEWWNSDLGLKVYLGAGISFSAGLSNVQPN